MELLLVIVILLALLAGEIRSCCESGDGKQLNRRDRRFTVADPDESSITDSCRQEKS